MEQQHEVICPWCQSEIHWDPEIGPEDMCPHCFNELGDYRSIKVGMDTLDEEVDDEDLDETDDTLDPVETDDDWEDNLEEDTYSINAQACIDEQEEAPECLNCRDLLLLTGERTVTAEEFTGHVPASLGKQILPAPFTVQFYVCPQCFRTEQILSDKDRLGMIERLSQDIQK
ncbi:hypothetical protein E0485_20730 [Paenibacillus albiflavus]|uniref:Uncharacterized protein n=1 Tax=Paenibacillus albiflavus TaxID=2545760 RepID=A0A4R4E7Q4_9BACL|nr:hypothetical protein [Paenibacillus albiflavus]TCZ73778.1 hypothetical protein E0485_20730 [Paenibacillus albiflavus]